MKHQKDNTNAFINVMEKRYQQAQAFMQGYTTTNLVQNESIFPHWIVDTNNKSINMFWYERAYQSGKQYRLVDAKNATNTVAFDHTHFANALAIVSKQDINAQDLPISHIGMTGSPLTVSFTAFSQRWQYSVEKQVRRRCNLSPEGGKLHGLFHSSHGKIKGKSWEKHKKNHRKNTTIIMAISGHFIVKLYSNNWFNGLIGFFRFGLV